MPLAPDVLERLRDCWQVGRPRQWLFVAQSDAQQPLQPESAQRWYRAACAHAGITKRGGIHTLRHCWATHLLEAGVDLHSLSQWLRHSQVSTTTRYLHLVRPDVPDGARSQPLAQVFRGKFLQALVLAERSDALARYPAQTPADRRQRLAAQRRHDWVAYAKSPMAGPATVLDYLRRYTHRTAVGNERLLGIEGDAVRLRVRANDQGGKRVVRIAGEEFIGRSLQHVLPPGLKRMRHYGLLAPALKCERLSQARALLQMPQTSRQAVEDAQAFMRRVAALEIDICAHCRTRRMRLVQLLAPLRNTARGIPGNSLSGAIMNAAGQHQKTAGWPRRSGHAGTCAFTGKHHCTDRVSARERARAWAVHGLPERATVVVTTHRQP